VHGGLQEARLKQWQSPQRPSSTLDDFAAASGYGSFAADAMARVRARLAGYEDDDSLQQQQQQQQGACKGEQGGAAADTPQQQQQQQGERSVCLGTLGWLQDTHAVTGLGIGAALIAWWCSIKVLPVLEQMHWVLCA
jgi:hypothetical protein